MQPITSLHRRSVFLFLLTAVTGILPLASCSQSGKSNPNLDGRVFTIITLPEGNPADAALERISFANGQFDNDNCHLWGFGSGGYTAKEDGETITFEATTTSAKEGTMTWTGSVSGEIISGKMIWKKAGQNDLHYTFTSDNIETVDLNGRSFLVQFTPGDSTTSETITFANGMMESPGCYAWGFSPANYQAYMLDGAINFQCLYTSEKEGQMLFYGRITGGQLSGTQFWTKQGQDDLYYSMSGAEL